MNHLNETQLNEYLDKVLDDASRQQADIHLVNCKECHAELDELKRLFFTLDDLPDILLAHNLLPDVLARLPKEMQIPALWRQPAFMVQSLLTLVLIVLSMPMLTVFGEQVAAWRNAIILPAMNFPSLPEIIAQFLPLMPEFSFALPKLSFTLPSTPILPTLPINPDTNLMLTLVLLSGILWFFGNLSLLRSKPEVRE
ncbi:MAG: hypothetical protein HN855_11005 [Anaerolineae bacterium]|jgi:hypothetical protein|nr:hypothetical protein [Anaerolineae bacterium]MBT7070000.1 hypothetical protein [Anaerolineae bacterium]MBT7325680.1 hypothetical protein [Anaerolineae bacterium]